MKVKLLYIFRTSVLIKQSNYLFLDTWQKYKNTNISSKY